MGKMIEFARPDGSSCAGYLAEAAPGRPAVIVIQEWWGLNDQIKRVAERFSAAGFTALAPDLYQGRVTQDPDEANHLMSGLDFAGATHQDIRCAARYLRERTKKVGITGFCMGGALTIAAAVHVPEIAAAVCFYGIPPGSFASPAQIRVPFQAHFARHDTWCTPEAVNRLEEEMLAADLAPEIYRYDAQHAFCNETRPEVYDAHACRTAFDRTMRFFGHHLG